jgi:hypothetical protein
MPYPLAMELKEPPMSPSTTVKFPNERDKKNKHE